MTEEYMPPKVYTVQVTYIYLQGEDQRGET